jgi:hypothetical protein
MIAKGIVVLLFSGMFGSVWWMNRQAVGVSPLRDQALYNQMRRECDEEDRLPNGECPRRAFRSFFFLPGYRGGPGYGK